MRRLLPFVIVSTLATLSACASARVGVGAAYTRGQTGVHGTASGVEGMGVEVAGATRAGAGELSLAVTADKAGYDSDGDGDPILWVAGSVRYRHWLEPGGDLRPFVGVGLGAGTDAGEHHLVVEGFAELGARLAVSDRLGLTLGLRERPAVFVGSGTPAAEYLNTLQLMGGVELAFD